MINIRQKTQDEIVEQEADYRWAASMVKGFPRQVCKTYLTKNDGTKVDTRDLSEDQILGLIYYDLVDFTSEQGTYKRTGRTDLDSFKLIEALKRDYTPSINATLQMCKMEQQFGHIVKDLIGSFGSNHYGKAEIIARYQKESMGDFTPVQKDEVIDVLGQMAINEQMKNSRTR